ncbi:hypothetical protein [Streptococcus cristatus]|uniref:hypothetical protein n=1 Tax=Streptococcus cristatus TaxID=45634 RepID=UPI0005EF23D3|nr:hypothetical protein [Streptococcus cristatus]KJQ61905.1 hypothetical protein TW70_00060 [Streptococcus cristatus]QIP49100.1 hypothetical protein HBA50_03530 [Streptococcus cristatus ATCC 51100]
MAKEDDYKNRSVGLPITIFIVFLTICLMIPLGKVMIMWGLKSAYEGLGRSSVSSTVRQKSSEELRLEEKVLERGNHRFTWTTDDIINLQIKDTTAGQNGASLDQILEKHGKASSFFYTESNENIELNYTSEITQGHHSSLRLTFEKDGSGYHLIGKSANILDEAYPRLPQGDSPHLWTKDDIAGLQVRDESTGNLGMSYDEIIQLFGLPRESEVVISHLDVADSQHIGLELKYLTSDERYNNEWVHLIFHRQEDGVFRLTTVTSHIDRRER